MPRDKIKHWEHKQKNKKRVKDHRRGRKAYQVDRKQKETFKRRYEKALKITGVDHKKIGLVWRACARE